MLSKLTLIGMSNYSDGAIWDDLNLPEGYDKEVVVSEILRQGGEFSVLYPDLDYMKYMIGIWAKKFYHNFDRWIKAYNFDYEALYNVDVKTTREDAIKDSGADTKFATSLKNHNGQGLNNTNTQSITNQNNNTLSTGKDQSQDTKSKAAYDASTFQNVEQDSLSSSSSLSTSAHNSMSSSEATSLSTLELSSDSESSSESTSNSWEHSQTTDEWKRGNYGTTMSQELLIAEYNAWRINIYEMVAELFVSEFCICIYN